MPIYTFECDECGARDVREMTFEEHEEYREPWRHYSGRASDDGCTGWFRQILDFSFHRGMPEHFSHTMNSFVKGERDYRDQLKIQSEEMSARMGFDCNYEVVDSRDPKDVGASDAGLEATERRLVDSGQVTPTAKSFS